MAAAEAPTPASRMPALEATEVEGTLSMMAEAFSSGVGSKFGVQEWVGSQVAEEEGGRQMGRV